jgi:hypothetical protein
LFRAPLLGVVDYLPDRIFGSQAAGRSGFMTSAGKIASNFCKMTIYLNNFHVLDSLLRLNSVNL